MNGFFRQSGISPLPAIFNNLISADIVSSPWGAVNLVYPVIAGACLVYLLRCILGPRFKWPLLTAGILPFSLHLLAAAAMGWDPGILLAGYLAVLAAVCGVFYKGPVAAKVYLSVTFCVFYLLGIQAMEHIGYGLFQQFLKTELPPLGNRLPVLIFYTCPLFYNLPYPDGVSRAVVYNVIFLLSISLSSLFLMTSVRYLVRKLKGRIWDMRRKELVFLLLPDGAGLSFYIFMTFIRQLLFETEAVDLAGRYGRWFYLIIPALTFAFQFAILYSCDIYERLLLFGEEKGRSDMLENQVKQMEDHIKDIEQLYTGIRSMKHDMKNYLFDIKSLLRARGIRVEEDADGLGAYFSGIGKAMEQMDAAYHTGNPVTDVVINGKYSQAKQQGIRFSCSFHFPEAYGISAFDVSIILNNSLNNALEACEKLKEQRPKQELTVSVEAYCRNNMFFIEVENTFDGVLRYEENGHILLTRKENAFEHGLGFQNIRQCAEKYLGAAEYRYSADKFHLTVMLQRVWEKR